MLEDLRLRPLGHHTRFKASRPRSPSPSAGPVARPFTGFPQQDPLEDFQLQLPPKATPRLKRGAGPGGPTSFTSISDHNMVTEVGGLNPKPRGPADSLAAYVLSRSMDEDTTLGAPTARHMGPA
jgi:hypothetical protein